MNLIFGVHSIKCALENPLRSGGKLYLERGLENEFQQFDTVEMVVVDKGKLQAIADREAKILDYKIGRVPGGAFLLCPELPELGVNELYQSIDHENAVNLLALDQITDVHNAAAIFRTAAFFGCDGILVGGKGHFGLTPTFFRIASGGFETVPLYRVSSLAKTIPKLHERSIQTIAFSEHSSPEAPPLFHRRCLFLGSEETGLSHALLRASNYQVSLESHGAIKSLNVSVASAISMERYFSLNK